jgi:lysophospholipase L1-like esterase
MRFAVSRLVFICALPAALLPAEPANQGHWIASWTTAQPLIRATPPAPRPPAPSGAPGAQPTGRGRQLNPAVQAINTNGLHNQTVRMPIRLSVGGSRVRIKLSNPFGGVPVVVGSAHIAMAGTGSNIVPESDHALTFNGKPTCTIGPGVVLLSDPVDMSVSKLADLAVSLFFPETTGQPASHNALRTTYISKEGDFTSKPEIPEPITTQVDYWLAGVEVMAPAASSVVVALGDSITEGFGSTPDTHHTWPAILAERMLANKKTSNMAVVNVGIGGNRLLHDGTGASALARLDRDVFSQPGVKYVIVLESINDIGRGATNPADAVTAEDLIGGFKQIIERAHGLGIKVIECTVPPYEGANYAREEGEAVRVALNNWIRTGHAFDGIADFESATKDPANPKRLRPEFDPRDHLHPNDAGYQAMANAIDLSLFTGK